MAESKVVYRPREGTTAGSELSALVAAYRFIIFECRGSEKGARPGAPDDEKGRSSNDSLAKKHSTT